MLAEGFLVMMIASTVGGLGLIPSWIFSGDPRVNINLNPHLNIPADWPRGQRTVQPLNYFAAKASGDPLSGLGITMAHWAKPPVGIAGIDYGWVWDNKKWLVLGGVGLMGLAVASILFR
jgi:hypothetical protein